MPLRSKLGLAGSKPECESVDRNKAKRVLVYRLGSLGDFIISLPCLHLVRKTYPNARRALLTNIPIKSKAAPAFQVLGQSELIHNYIAYPVGIRSLIGLFSIWIRVARFRPEVLIYLAKPREGRALKRDALFFRLCGIRELIGIPTGDCATNMFNERTGLYEAEAARLGRCLRSLGDAMVDNPKSWDLCLTNREMEDAAHLIQHNPNERLICCGVGTKQAAKDWGVDNWRSLLATLSISAPAHTLVMLGSSDEHALSESAAIPWRGKRLNLCGATTPRQAGAVLRLADLFIGHDSGPMHLAAAVGTPSVSVFSGQSKPGVWFPFGKRNSVIFHDTQCSGCGLQECVKEKKKCILSITPGEVLSAALKTLCEQRAGRPEEPVLC